MVGDKLFEKAKTGCGRIASLVVLSIWDLILFICIVPMLRHPGCSFVDSVVVRSFIVAMFLYGKIAMWYMCPGLISMLLGVFLFFFEQNL